MEINIDLLCFSYLFLFWFFLHIHLKLDFILLARSCGLHKVHKVTHSRWKTLARGTANCRVTHTRIQKFTSDVWNLANKQVSSSYTKHPRPKVTGAPPAAPRSPLISSIQPSMSCGDSELI